MVISSANVAPAASLKLQPQTSSDRNTGGAKAKNLLIVLVEQIFDASIKF